MQIREVDVVIVGAGLSGLRAATLIQQAGLSCAVLEAMERVGGKTLSVSASSKGGRVDLGAAWINDTSQSEMYALAKQFKFDLIQQRATGMNIHQSADGKVFSMPYGTDDVMNDPALEDFLVKLNEYVENCDLEYPELGPDAKTLDSMTALEFVQKNFGDYPAAVTTAACTALLGVEAEEVSALYLIHYIKSGTGLANLSSDLNNGAQYLRNRQGNQAFSSKMAEMLKPGTLHLSTPVTRIDQLDSGHCEVYTADDTHITCRKIVVSIPTTLHPMITFNPPLPAAKQELSLNTALGYYAKFIFVFSSPWWREAGFSGVIHSEPGPITISWDTSSEKDDQFSISCFMLGDTGRRWSKFSTAERRKQATEQFGALFNRCAPQLKIPEPINVIEHEWIKDPWFQGGPCPVLGPGVMTSEAGKAIRDVFKNVHFVGTETSVHWKGYMEGAVRSGVRGADEVIKALRKD